jgi:hypothetical protein
MPSPAWQRGSGSPEASGHRRQRDLVAASIIRCPRRDDDRRRR